LNLYRFLRLSGQWQCLFLVQGYTTNFSNKGGPCFSLFLLFAFSEEAVDLSFLFKLCKLLHEGNYRMATTCFERARYEYGEKLAKASAFKADADLKHVLSPKEASDLRRQAAEIFEAIGVADSAAECFYMLKEYEKAGMMFTLFQFLSK